MIYESPYTYPVKSNEDFKSQASGINISLDETNLESGMKRAAHTLKSTISEAVWNRIIDHYNSDSFGDTSNDTNVCLNSALQYLQEAFVPYTLYYHFIWLQIQVSNSSISVPDKENLPYKYQLDEAKDDLIEQASIGVDRLIRHLNNSTDTITEWANSTQYTEIQNLVFKGYEDFNKSAGIITNATFFIQARHIILQAAQDNIVPRKPDYAKSDDTILLDHIKRFLALQTLAEACLQMDFLFLPAYIRKATGNEHGRKRDNPEFIREKLSENYRTKAQQKLETIDYYLNQKNTSDIDEIYQKFKSDLTEDDKFSNMGL